MDFHFNILFTVKFIHPFFENGIDGNLLLKPSKETQRLMTNSDLLQKKDSEHGLIILGPEVKSDTGMVAARVIPKSFILSFLINSEKENFYSITSISPRQPDEVYYFSNQSKSDFELSSQGKVSSKDVLKVRRSKFIYLPDKKDQGKSMVIENVLGELVFKVDKLNDSVKIDLTNEGLGKYNIKIAGKQVESFCLLHQSQDMNVIGVLEVVQDQYSLIDEDAVFVKPEYALNFAGRQTYWDYRVILNKNISYNQLEVVDEESKRVNIPPELVTPINGREVVSLILQEPILLRQNQNRTFKLIMNTGESDRSKVLLNHLPYPETDIIIEEKNQYQSRIYINI